MGRGFILFPPIRSIPLIKLFCPKKSYLRGIPVIVCDQQSKNYYYLHQYDF